MSLAGLSEAVHYSRGYLSKIENGQKPPTEELARLCDHALGARGDLIAAAHLDVASTRDVHPWETAELLNRIQSSDVRPVTIDALEATVYELCCQYAYRDATELRAEAHTWLRHVADNLNKPVGLAAHRELLTAAGWLALLVGCIEYDLGLRAAAEATRAAAKRLGAEAGNSEIVGWTHEMSAWFALTQGRYPDVIRAARAGLDADRDHSVAVQLVGQEAKALARMGNIPDLRRTLAQGRKMLDQFSQSERPDHHFVVDPEKWDFYAMDAYRLAGDDQRAAEHAREVIAVGTGRGGIEIAPMRIAEARLTLGVVAARQGEVEEAVQTGLEALSAARRSLPSLLMVASELDSVLNQRFAKEPAVIEFRDVVRSLR